jgi:hypothetical protein
MRCPDCAKFVSLELQDPEVSNLDVAVDNVDAETKEVQFTITGNVRIVRTCAECSNELKEATLDIEQSVELGEDSELTAADITADYVKWFVENAPEVEETNINPIEEGGGRYQKSFFGAEVTFELKRDDKVIARVTWSDKVAASSMDELV